MKSNFDTKVTRMRVCLGCIHNLPGKWSTRTKHPICDPENGSLFSCLHTFHIHQSYWPKLCFVTFPFMWFCLINFLQMCLYNETTSLPSSLQFRNLDLILWPLWWRHSVLVKHQYSPTLHGVKTYISIWATRNLHINYMIVDMTVSYEYKEHL
jgi:hypothetical protein